MIHGEATTPEGETVLNIRWPQRGLYRVVADTGEEALIWDDCEGDALESMAVWLGREGEDDAFDVFGVDGETRARIVAFCDVINAE